MSADSIDRPTTPCARPELVAPNEHHRGLLCWRWAQPPVMVSSAPVGGGWTTPSWLVNLGVSLGYRRTDLAAHAAATARSLGLTGEGATLFTAADVSRVRSAERDGVQVDATVGVSAPTWAADASGGYTAYRPGTINVVVQVPVRLSDAAMVNAVMTVTEAKTQALLEAHVPGTGTASDAVAVICRGSGRPETFGGPRSPWGARIALAAHASVAAGLAAQAC
ncbi:MAG: adenosylcobinamide amidohydrolase [Ornithinimicrobium sp.]